MKKKIKYILFLFLFLYNIFHLNNFFILVNPIIQIFLIVQLFRIKMKKKNVFSRSHHVFKNYEMKYIRFCVIYKRILLW